MDIAQLATLVAVVKAGSFTAAASALGTHKAHTSRVISRLERRLGVRLLQRSTRSLALTEVGRELYERATNILAALDDTQAAIQQTQAEPHGTLRLTCGVDFGLLVVNGWISGFLERYPKVRIDAEFSDHMVDLIHDGFDLAIRIGQLADSGLSARKLGEIRFALYASPRYLRRHEKPKRPTDLASHDMVIFAATSRPMLHLSNGAQRHDVRVQPRLRINNHIAACDGAVNGTGIALLPRFQATPYVETGKLVEVLPGWTRAPTPIQAIFASSRYLTPKVRAFIDFALAHRRKL
jgi:LysR family transcriptional regulator for bpeEF and oprC